MEKVLFQVIDIVIVLFSILFIIFSHAAFKNNYYEYTIAQEYSDNWNKGPIIDIISTQNNCPKDYEPLIQNTFPANTAGCNCLNSTDDNFKGKIFKDKCEYDHIVDRCKMIFKNNATILNIWKSTKLCVLRRNENFWQLETDASNTNDNKGCKRGYVSCGKLDSSGNLLCLKDNEKCPINAVEILTSDKTPSFNNYKRIEISNGRFLYFTNTETNNEIINGFIVQSNICTHPEEGLLGENDYILNVINGPNYCKTTINNERIDPRFYVLDSQPTLQFYNENKIDSIIKILPNYPVVEDTDIVDLYSSHYFGINKKCFNDKEFIPETLLSPKTEVLNTQNRVSVLCTLCIFHFIITILFIIVYKIIIAKLQYNYFIVFLFDIVNVCFMFSIMIVTINANSSNSMSTKPYFDFVAKNCGDPITNSALNEAFSNIIKVKSNLVPIIVMSIIELVFILLNYTIYFVRTKENFLTS